MVFSPPPHKHAAPSSGAVRPLWGLPLPDPFQTPSVPRDLLEAISGVKAAQSRMEKDICGIKELLGLVSCPRDGDGAPSPASPIPTPLLMGTGTHKGTGPSCPSRCHPMHHGREQGRGEENIFLGVHPKILTLKP